MSLSPERRLRVVEVASFLLVPVPFLTEFFERGTFPRGVREWATEVAMTCIILAFVGLLRKATFELKERDELRAALMSTLVHDLKSPVTAIVVSAKLSAEAETPEERTRFVDIVLRSCHRQIAMVDTLIDLERLETSTLVPQKARLPVGDILAQVKEDQRPVAEHVGAVVEASAPEGLLVHADPALLSRVLNNLLGNALKHLKRGGRVGVSVVRAAGGGARFSVKDDGPGILPAAQRDLFQRFKRVDGDPSPGTGLGLYLCRLAVEAHGGRIGIISDLGAGAEFWFELPDGPETG